MNSDTIKEVETPKEIEVSGQFEGIPYRGTPINLKKTDDPMKFMKLNRVLHVKRFNLEDEKDLKKYEAVCQEIEAGHSQLSFEERQYNEKTLNWVVLIRWIEWWYSPLGENDK
jgi:hypothetical protein